MHFIDHPYHFCRFLAFLFVCSLLDIRWLVIALELANSNVYYLLRSDFGTIGKDVVCWFLFFPLTCWFDSVEFFWFACVVFLCCCYSSISHFFTCITYYTLMEYGVTNVWGRREFNIIPRYLINNFNICFYLMLSYNIYKLHGQAYNFLVFEYIQWLKVIVLTGLGQEVCGQKIWIYYSVAINCFPFIDKTSTTS